MDEFKKEKMIRDSGSVRKWLLFTVPITTSLFSVLILIIFLFQLFAVPPAHCTLIESEQRERIGEIDKELGELRHGRKAKGLSGKINLKGIRHYANKSYARVVLDLSSLPKYRVEEGGEKDTVFRLVLQNTGLFISPLDCGVDPNKGLLKCVTARKVGKGVFVNIFSSHPSQTKVFNLTGPPRIVIDVYKQKKYSPKSTTLPAVGSRMIPAKKRKIVVVIDPGHGGKDPGAIGKRGLKEKHVVLKIGKKLKKYLDKDKKFSVYMTRKKDVFLTLEKRTAIANGAGADIFISVHTNASRKRSARGISSFVLGKKATDKEALELAMSENGTMLENDSKVNYILMDLINYGIGKESLKLAKVINDEIVTEVKGKRKHVLNLGVRKAPFYVLFGASMPAVLVEASFITNSYEEKLLAKDWYLDIIARSIYTGITNYIDRSKTAFYGEASQ